MKLKKSSIKRLSGFRSFSNLVSITPTGRFFVFGEGKDRIHASTVIEGIGPMFFGEKEEIYQRARSAYEKEIKP